MVKIIHTKPSHKQELERLWQDCFHDPAHYADYYFQQIYAYNDVLAVEKDGQIVSMLHLNPYEIYFNGRVIPSNYIVGVATRKDHRHKGYMSMLLRQVFNELNVSRVPFVYLMPADPAIYKPSNFTYIYNQFVIEKKKSHRKQPPVPGGYLSSRKASQTDICELVPFANSVLKTRCDVFAWRDKRYFENLIKETSIDRGGIELLYDEMKKLAGYVAYVRGEKLEIREVMSCEERESHVLRWLCNHFSEEEGTLLTFPLSMSKSMKEPSFWNSYYKPIIMARIVNLKAFLELARAQEDFQIVIRVKDSWIEENNGEFLWQIMGGESHVLKKSVPDIQAASLRAVSQVTATIEGLAAWLFGYKTLQTLIIDGEISTTEESIKKLEKVQLIKGILLNEIV